MTDDGASPNKPCIFPFKLRSNNETYTKCRPGIDGTNHKPWCSTQVDKHGVHLSGQGLWGNCGPNCPVEKGNIAAGVIRHRQQVIIW